MATRKNHSPRPDHGGYPVTYCGLPAEGPTVPEDHYVVSCDGSAPVTCNNCRRLMVRVLGERYLSLVGYDPFEDDPTITVEEVAQTIAEYEQEAGNASS